MAKQLHYFNVNGLGESIRYILHYTKQEFDDIRHDLKTWPNHEVKASLPYGQLPVYKEGDRCLHQSLAIAKYVARNTDLIPSDPWLQAVLDSTVHTIYDFWAPVLRFIHETDPAKKKELKEKIIEETIDFFFSRFEKHLKENGGFFTGKLSWAEFLLVGIVESTNLVLEFELEESYPTVAAVVKLIRELPGVEEYIATREIYEP